MNYEHLKELALEAGYQEDSFGRGHWDCKEFHDFSELLVKECIKQIQLSTARDPRDTAQYKQSVGHIHKIRQHFGVE